MTRFLNTVARVEGVREMAKGVLQIAVLKMVNG
jgi:hypothetical protein